MVSIRAELSAGQRRYHTQDGRYDSRRKGEPKYIKLISAYHFQTRVHLSTVSK